MRINSYLKFFYLLLIHITFAYSSSVFAATYLIAGILTPVSKGVMPHSNIGAAAPINSIPCHECFLRAAIMDALNTNDVDMAYEKMNSNGKIYFGQNNSQITNGTFNMHEIPLPKEFANAKKIKINIIIAAESYKEIKGYPELALDLYKNISPKDLRRKFETQQFLHQFFMKKYDIGLKRISKCYECGAQELSAVINLNDLSDKNKPLLVVVRYTKNGFHLYQKKRNPKVIIYAYLIEIEKIS